jgi:hypothetical protein
VPSRQTIRSPPAGLLALRAGGNAVDAASRRQ